MTRRLARPLGLALVLVLGIAPPSAAQSLSRVYSPKHRAAEDLLPAVEAAMAGEGSAVVDRASNSLVLVGSSRAIAEALVVLAKLDRRLRSVVLHYESRGLREIEAAGVQVAWSAGSGALRVGNVIWPRGETGAVIVPEGFAGTREGGFAGSLRLIEGESGRLLTGTSVPVTTRRVERGFGGVVVRESQRQLHANSGFDARARILGDGRVQVDLAPFEAELGAGGTVRRSSAETSVVVEPGESVAVGGFDLGSSERSGSIVSGARDEREREQRVLLLRVEVE